MNYKVVEVIDGDTFSIDPKIKRKEYELEKVRPTGYNTPEMGKPQYAEMTKKLRNLILGQNVDVGPVKDIDRDRAVCDVTFQGKDLADYFPEYKI